MKKITIILFIGILLVVILGSFLMSRLYLSCNPRFNNPDNQDSFSNKICSLISLPFKSGYEGRSCSEKSICGRGYCVWDDQEQKGICRDNPRGCVGIINEKGKPEKAPVCFD